MNDDQYSFFDPIVDVSTLINALYVEEADMDAMQIGAIEGGFNILIVGSDTRGGQYGIGGSVDEDNPSLAKAKVSGSSKGQTARDLQIRGRK